MKNLTVKLLVAAMCILAIVFGINSCGDNHVVGFHKVEIPEYTSADYLKLLDNSNNDIVYNAISNLIDPANDFGKILSNDTIKDTVQYMLAKEVYTKVSALLKSDDEWVVCAAIRFMAAFASDYKNKDEVIEKLIDVKKMTKSIQLELVDGFTYADGSGSKAYEKKVKYLLSQTSWLVNRYAYRLAGSPENQQNLINNYSKASEDFEKLLILGSIGENFNDSTFTFFTNEMLSTSDNKIRLCIIKRLNGAKNKELVTKWLNDKYTFYAKYTADFVKVYESNIETGFASQLFITLIGHGYNPATSLTDDKEPRLYQQLSEKLTSFNNKKDCSKEDSLKLKNLKNLERAIISNEICKKQWDSFKEKHKTLEFPAEMLTKHKQQMEELIGKTKALFEKYKIDAKFKEDYLNKLQSADQELYEQAKR
jgi:hypothetical protein